MDCLICFFIAAVKTGESTAKPGTIELVGAPALGVCAETIRIPSNRYSPWLETTLTKYLPGARVGLFTKSSVALREIISTFVSPTNTAVTEDRRLPLIAKVVPLGALFGVNDNVMGPV